MSGTMEILKGDIGAGGQVVWNVNGEYFELIDAAAVDVDLLDRNGVILKRMIDGEAGFYLGGAFASVVIRSATAQTVRFFVGDGTAGTRRLSGFVTVLDNAKASALAQQEYMARIWRPLLAANYSHVQLWNPGGSGRNLVVHRYAAMSADAVPPLISLYTHNAALGALAGSTVNKFITAFNVNGPTAAQPRSVNAAAPVAGTLMDDFQLVAANQRVIVTPAGGPIIIPPGMSLVMVGNGLAKDLTGYFEFREELA